MSDVPWLHQRILDPVTVEDPLLGPGAFFVEGGPLPPGVVNAGGSFPHVIVSARRATGIDEDGTPVLKADVLYEGPAALYTQDPIHRTHGSSRALGVSQSGTHKALKIHVVFPYNGSLPHNLTVEVATDHETYQAYQTTEVWYNGYRAVVELERAK